MRRLILALVLLVCASPCLAGGPQLLLAALKGATAPPPQVTGVTASNSPAQVTVSWSVVSGATSYNVYYRATIDDPSGKTLAGTTAATSYNINGPLNRGTTYFVWVSAQNGAGEGALSLSGSAIAAPVAVNDNFNRADGPLGVNWLTGTPAATISNNALTGSGGSIAVWNGVFSNDQYAVIKGNGSPVVRGSAGNTGYWFNEATDDDSNTYISLVVNGWKEIGGCEPFTAPYKRIEAQGSNIRVYQSMDGINWGTPLIDVIDTDLTTGSPGIVPHGLPCDDFMAGDL